MRRVFIADDDSAMRNMLASSLRLAGFEVECAEDGGILLDRVAAAATAGAPPDLVITDMKMPGVNGLEVIKRVHEIVESIPVILITAFGDASTHRRAHQLGAVAVMDKPFDLSALRQRVIELVADD